MDRDEFARAIDRQSGGVEALASVQVQLSALFTQSQLVEAGGIR